MAVKPSTQSMLDRYPCRDGQYNLLPDAVAVYDRYQRRVVRLDSLGSEIWIRIDGRTTLRDIAMDIAGQSGRNVLMILQQAIAMTGILSGEGLVYLSLEPATQPYHLSLPRADQDPQQAEDSMRASGWVNYYR